VFAVNSSVGAKSFDELAAYTKAHPKTMTYMAPSISKVAFMEEFNSKNGTDIVRVPFKGGGDAVNSMLTGTTPIAIFGIGNLIQFIRAGQIVGYAVDSDQRSPLAPEIPTFREIGYTNYIIPSNFGVFAPMGTPKAIIDKFNKAIVQVASSAEFQQKHMTLRGLAPVLDTPEQYAQQLVLDRKADYEAVKASGLYPDVK
jgi:tripartite-type tricarboxylate transporter receptor subunit TctC